MTRRLGRQRSDCSSLLQDGKHICVYGLDAAGNRTAMDDLDGTHSYEYDALHRLESVTYPDQETDAYTYDAVGNRLTKDTDDYTYDAADQLTELEGTSFDYDDNGNQTDRGSDTFEYDHENRLTASDTDSVGATYESNGDGLRVTRTIDQTSVSYVWDVAAGLPVILQDSDGNTYLYGLDLISRTDSGGEQEYYLYDGLGSTTDLTDDGGDVLASYGYDVFGAIRGQTGSSPNEFTFTGEQVDGTGLQYLRSRYYDPASGRFLGRDPLPGWAQRPQTQNPYPYVMSNPLNLRDPYGLCGLCDWVDDNVVDPVDDNVVDPVGEGLQQVGEGVSNFDLEDLGYVDINFTGCVRACVVVGGQLSFGGIHGYLGGGVGSTQFGLNATVAPGQHITTGWNCGFQVSAGRPGFGASATAQVGGAGFSIDKEGRPNWKNAFGEVGASYGFSGPVEWSNTCVYIF
jgi:RHS repeat-associated protein